MEKLEQKYMDTLQIGVASLRGDTGLADVEILVNDEAFPCHKAVLTAMSPYFRTMFTGSFGESHQNKITLHDVEKESFRVFLDYVYTGKLNVKDPDVPDILQLAALFQVDCLQEACEELLLGQLKLSNCLQLYRLSCLYNCPALKEKAWPVMLEGFCTWWKFDGFTELAFDELIAVIKEDNLVTLDEEHICEAALKWVNADLNHRKQYLYQIFRHIRLPHVTPEYMVYELSRNRLLMDSLDCQRLLNDAQHYHMLPARQLDFSGLHTQYRTNDDLDEVLLAIAENDGSHGGFYDGSWCLWAYSYRQNRWFTLASIPLSESPGKNFAICSHGYDIYLTGGEKKPKAMLKFETQRNEWIQSTGQMKKGRYNHSMAAITNRLYCVGGIQTKHSDMKLVIGTVEEYNIPAQQWVAVAEIQHPVHSAAAAVSGEKILVFGGIGKEGEPMNYVQCFHGRTQAVSVISCLPYPSSQIMTVKVSETVYVLSGREDGYTVFRLMSEYGLEDAGIEIPETCNILGCTHHKEQLIVLTQTVGPKRQLAKIHQINLRDNEAIQLPMKGNVWPKLVHSCHRSYVDKRYLFNTYFK